MKKSGKMNIKMKIIVWSALAFFITSCQEPGSPKEMTSGIETMDLVQLKEVKKSLEEKKKGYTDAVRSVKEKIDLLKKDEKKGKPVEVGAVVKKEFAHYLKVHGVAEATNNILINPEVGGAIRVIHVREGQKVSKGQKLITIDNSTVVSNINSLESQLEFATIMHDKQKSLFDQNIGTEVQYLQAKNQKESLENSIKTLQSQLSKFIIKAPVSGTVDQVFPKQGELAAPQMPLVRVVNLDKVFIEADVSESLLGKINSGDVVDVDFGSIDYSTKGKIVQVGQFINPFNRTFKIRVDLVGENNPMIKPNMLSVVRLKDYYNPEVVVIDTKIILQDYEGDFVFVNEEEIAVKKRIVLGKSYQSETEILEGLTGSESMIYAGYRNLTAGEMLEVRTK